MTKPDRSALALLVLFVAAVAPAFAQHEGMPMPGMQDQAKDKVVSAESLGSGTMPKASSAPEYMWMTTAGDWDIMTHGQLFFTYDQQGGPRGVGKFDSMNWL